MASGNTGVGGGYFCVENNTVWSEELVGRGQTQPVGVAS